MGDVRSRARLGFKLVALDHLTDDAVRAAPRQLDGQAGGLHAGNPEWPEHAPAAFPEEGFRFALLNDDWKITEAVAQGIDHDPAVRPAGGQGNNVRVFGHEGPQNLLGPSLQTAC